MCGLCPDVYGGCDQIECGARPKVDENGNRRPRYMRWFTYGEIACQHVASEHADDCPVPKGGYGCSDTCRGDDDD